MKILKTGTDDQMKAMTTSTTGTNSGTTQEQSGTNRNNQEQSGTNRKRTNMVLKTGTGSGTVY